MTPIQVLVVEDNAADAFLIQQVLSDYPEPIALRVAQHGEQALVMLVDTEFQPDLIILDLNGPRLAGLELLERLALKDIPIVVFSSFARPDEIQRALALGAREYVQKPIDLEPFAAALWGIIKRWAATQTGWVSRGGDTA